MTSKRSSSSSSRKKSHKSNASFFDAIGCSNFFQNEKINFFIGILLLCIGIFMIISFISFFTTGFADQSTINNMQSGDIENTEQIFKNYCGSHGAYISHFCISKYFGIGAFCIPVFIIIMSLRMMKTNKINIIKSFFILMVIMLWSSVAFAKFLSPFFETTPFTPGGEHGEYIKTYLQNIIGAPGLIIILLLILIAFLIYLSVNTINVIRAILNPSHLFNHIPFEVIDTSGSSKDGNSLSDDNDDKSKTEPPFSDPDTFDNPSTNTIEWAQPSTDSQQSAANYPQETNGILTTTETSNEDEETQMQIEVGQDYEKAHGQTLVQVGNKQMEAFDPKKDLSNYHYPTLELLTKYDDDGQTYVDKEEQEQNKNRIIEVLHQFGVEISSIKATIGPTITLYEITPAPGIRISKIKNLEDDIALSLAAKGIRIIAPIPGKGTIGIEVPNARPRIVSMESILNSRKFQETTMELPIALGKTITNEVFMVDLAKIPHLLVAGATGQGKSVGLNAIIASLLYKKHPSELKIVLVDPKKVEFSIYTSLYHHFLAAIPEEDDYSEPIITDVTKVVRTLNSLCKEMDTRYDLLKAAHVRNIKEYNQKFMSRTLNPLLGHKFMPYIVVVIDEFGDLILTAGKEVEMPITRIAQLARAVGIHMVIATQRPTTTIITGNIKANFPGRMAFKVTAMIDSRTILDRPGANQLVGRGDMLFLNSTEPVRVQCAFLDTPEVERIAEYIASQQGYSGPFELPEPDTPDVGGDALGDNKIGPLDPLFEEAALLIIQSQQGSTSLIQRKFSIGYNRAGRLMDQLEKAGIVGSAQGSKPREVLIADENSLARIISKLNYAK